MPDRMSIRATENASILMTRSTIFSTAAHSIAAEKKANSERTAVEQIEFLYREMSSDAAGIGGFAKFLSSWFRGGRLVVTAYRSKRFWWLLLGRYYMLSWVVMWPFYVWCRLLGGRHEISHQADIGCGFRVVHCSLGCVVNRLTVAGRNLYLTGGNVIGVRRVDLVKGAIRLGDDVMLGIGAMVIGPLIVGDRARIGAGTVIVKDIIPGATAVGSPVRYLNDAI